MVLATRLWGPTQNACICESSARLHEKPRKLSGSMKTWQEWLRNDSNCLDLWTLTKCARDRHLGKIHCPFCCLMRWCRWTLLFPKYILRVSLVKGRTMGIDYGVITRYRCWGPSCVRNGRVMWSLKEQLGTSASINTPCCSVHLRYRCISITPQLASLCQSE